MQALLSGAGIADILIGLIVAEALALALRRPQALAAALPGLCAGLGLAAALRCTLTGAPWPWLAGCLAAAGMAHAFEVYRRWRH